MVTRDRGAAYAVSPPPLQGGLPELRQWCEREFQRIATAINEGRSISLRLDVLSRPPDRPQEGMIVYLAADALAPGSVLGAYEWRGAAWIKL